MADRYFIGTGNRNLLDAANWSLTSGGAPYQPASGTEKITNAADREFSSDTGFWMKAANTTISGGVLTSNIASNGSLISKTNFLTIGKCYKIVFDVVSISAGYLTFGGATGPTPAITTTGTKTRYGIAEQTAFDIASFDGFIGSVDNVSVQEVDDVVPTSSINAIFDANSGTGTVTVNGNFSCADLTISNLAGALTISGSVYTFNVYGNLTLPATNLTWTFTGTSYLYLKATTSVNITMGAITERNFNNFYIDGVGGTWTLQDDFVLTSGWGLFYLINGTLDTNNKTVTVGNFIVYPGTNSVIARASTIKCYKWNQLNPSFAFDAGTSTLQLPGVPYGEGIISGYPTTFHNISFAFSPTDCNFKCETDVTVSNNLSLQGYNNTNKRLLVYSSIIGTPRTITCNGSIVASNVDFRDITGTGTASWDLSGITGGSGDCGGNSGITFTPAMPQYYKHVGGGTTLWSDSTKWFSDAALTVAGRVPLPQDDANFIAGSFSQACTLNVNCPRIGRSLDMSGVSQAVTMNLANDIECYGSYVLGNNITPSGGFGIYLHSRIDFFVNFYNKTISYIQFNNHNAKCTFLSNITTSTQGLQRVANCIVDFNDFDVTTAYYVAALGGIQTTYMGNGIITITGGIGFSATNVFYAESSTLKFNPSANAPDIDFAAENKSFNKVQFSGSHTGNFNISGSNTFNELIIDKGRKVRFTGGTTQTIGKLTNNGAAGNLTTIGSTTTTKANIALPTVQNIDYANISYINVTAANKLFAGLNSVDGGNNVNVVFGAIGNGTGIVGLVEEELLNSYTNGVSKIIPTWTEEEVLLSTLQALKGLLIYFIEEESLSTTMSYIKKLLAQFEENEILYTNLITKIPMVLNMSDVEDMNIPLYVKYLITASFSEAEDMYNTLCNRVALLLELQEEELLDSTGNTKISIQTLFTEEELLFINYYEKVTGFSNFTYLIKRDSLFLPVITNTSNF